MGENHGGESMIDYYIGMAIGGLIGYGLSLCTMIAIWSLCVVAKQADEGREYAESHKKTEQYTAHAKRIN
jgi:hypothetical protein